MSTKMKKGILRPFRYISNMMDGKEAAQDMQIGFPTDVKHVAHIGWDGPSVPNNNNTAGAPSWMKDYHSAPLDSASFRSDRGGSAAANPWASQEIVVDGGSLGDTSFSETRSEAGGSMDITAGDSPPSPDSRRSRRHRSRGSAATSSMDCTAADGGAAPEKKDKAKKSSRGKNRKKDKSDKSAAAGAGDDASGATCQDLPAVPKKSNRRKNKGGSEGTGAAAASKADGAGAGGEDAAAPEPPATEEAQDHD
uniref:CRIB domain-containing protein n=2 Tax=Oryza TaxID=4527 RepID=A0A0D3GQF3_9ORYZ